MQVSKNICKTVFWLANKEIENYRLLQFGSNKFSISLLDPTQKTGETRRKKRTEKQRILLINGEITKVKHFFGKEAVVKMSLNSVTKTNEMFLEKHKKASK